MLEKIKPYFLYIGLFALVSCLIFYPEVQGKELSAHDLVSWHEASKEWKDYKDKGEGIYWTNRIFSGMPLHTIAGNESGNYIGYIFGTIKEMAPNNISNIFIVFICIFFSLVLLHVNKKIAFGVSLALGLNTWILGSLYAAHSTKILSLAFLVPVVAGHISYLRYKNLVALIFIILGLNLSVAYGHYQIVYYGVIINVLIALYFLYEAFIQKTVKNYAIRGCILLVIVIIAALPNLSQLLLVNDYNKETMRGGKTELIKPEANSTGKEGGLDINYAFSWSYSWSELINFLAPDAMGGSSNYKVKTKSSKLAQAMNTGEDKVTIPMYWGIQPFAEANYLGACIFFLFVFLLFYSRDKIKYLFLGLFLLSVFMGLGRSFIEFNQILFDYLPLYNKFRTPTMSLSILTITSILFIGYGLHSFFFKEIEKPRFLQSLKYTYGLILFFIVVGYISISNAGYTSPADNQFVGNNKEALNLLIEDRMSFFKKDLFRALLILSIAGGLLYFYVKESISKKTTISLISILIFLDLFTIHLRYHENDVFQKAKNVEELIPNEAYNQYLEQDKTHFRIFNTTSQSVFSSNTDGYRFSNVGGYSPAKLYRYQDLIDVHLSKGNFPVLNMLNTKYIIVDNQGQKIPQQNPDACGNAWFIKEVKFAKNANEEIDSIGTFNPKNSVWIDQRFKNETNYGINTDPNASISLSKYHPDNMEYSSSSTTGGFVVFSEIWYKGNEDWNLYINGKPQKLVRVNYLLRGAYIPAGNNKIEMKFKVTKLERYKMIGACFSLLIVILSVGIIYFEKRKSTK
jgi:hypothetical protein